MSLRPGAQGILFALPGLLLSLWAGLISVAGFASGMPFGLAAEIFGVAIALSVLWLPVVVYLLTTRLTVDAEKLEMRSVFGWRTKRLARSNVGRISTSSAEVAGDADDTGIPVSYFDIYDRRGRRWARLRSWVWNRSDCERLVAELRARGSQPALHEAVWPPLPEVVWPPIPGATAPQAITAAAPADAAVAASDGFTSFLQSGGCALQGCSTLIGFGAMAVFAAAAFKLPMGRELGAAAVPGAIVGSGIGSSALLARPVYGFLTAEAKLSKLAARLISAALLLLIPTLLWIAALLVASAAAKLLSGGQ